MEPIQCQELVQLERNRLPYYYLGPTVSEIDLYNSSISSTLDQFSFASFPYLSVLDLGSNNISGPIPVEIGKCKDLQELNLYQNQLSGPIPPSVLANLTNIRFLNVGGNNLSGPIPFEIGNCKDLWMLNFSQNQLSGPIPSIVGNLTNLQVLGLSSNNLTGPIPVEVGNLKNAHELDFSRNQLSGPILQTLIGNMSSLFYVNLDFNFLQGPLPVIPLSMNTFSAANNQLTGKLDSSICNWTTPGFLDLSDNSFGGEIPKCLGNFSLLVLMLQLNRFQGAIPSTFTKGSELKKLILSDNQFEGPVPLSLVNCTQLEVLDLAKNNLRGTFPYWLDSLPELKVLVLHANRLYGTIAPTSSTKLRFAQLRVLDLSDNKFTGLLPFKYIENFKAMRNISTRGMNTATMANNMSSSALPIEEYSITLVVKGLDVEIVRILTVFTTIDLSSIMFEGGVPDSIGKLHSLRNLNLSHNSLTGRIPALLGNLTVLESLDLSSNKLVGEIPQQLTRLTFLAVLNLSHNQLSGGIPQGPQFNTFKNDSYQGNLELCGSPLTKKCRDDEADLSEPTLPEQEDDIANFFYGFTWESVLVGYGIGMLFGLSIGSLVMLSGKPRWLARIMEEQIQKWRRSRKGTGQIKQLGRRINEHTRHG